MIYVKKIILPDAGCEHNFLCGKGSMTCYDSVYPFNLFSSRALNEVVFDDITILYGGNGSGKTTLLNIIAQKLGVKLEGLFNHTDFFDDYLDLCYYEVAHDSHYRTGAIIPLESTIITSDDVFQQLIKTRQLNNSIDQRRRKACDERDYERAARVTSIKFEDSASIAAFRRNTLARRKSKSAFLEAEAGRNIVTQSNGETAFNYFMSQLQPGNIYLLDEPENSLSPHWQLELANYLQTEARYEDCQLIIATHSPFFMAMSPAIIYNLDLSPIKTQHWYELENMRVYYDFFKMFQEKFEDTMDKELF